MMRAAAGMLATVVLCSQLGCWASEDTLEQQLLAEAWQPDVFKWIRATRRQAGLHKMPNNSWVLPSGACPWRSIQLGLVHKNMQSPIISKAHPVSRVQSKFTLQGH